MQDSVIRLRGVRKLYGKTAAVDGLDLDVPRGSVFGLLGPNGAGKSTTFGMLCGWIHPTSGTTEVLGVTGSQLHTLRGRVAAQPQDAHFPASVSIRLQLAHFARLSGVPANRADAEALRVLEIVGLTDAANKTGAQLSHGMHKRVGLAQALVGEPEVLFLDEPTSGLDPRTAHLIKQRIAALAPKATVVLSSHNLVEVQEICTHGAILDHGRLTISGTIQDLTRRGAEFTLRLVGDVARALQALQGEFGSTEVRLGDPDTIIVRHPADVPSAVPISAALRLVLAEGLLVSDVTRGTSLERAFLEFTDGVGAPQASPS